MKYDAVKSDQATRPGGQKDPAPNCDHVWRVSDSSPDKMANCTICGGSESYAHVIDSFLIQFQAHVNLYPGDKTPEDLENDCRAALNGGTREINLMKLLKAKFISDLSWRLGVAPGNLTNQQLLSERNRIAAIYKAL